MKGLFHRRSPAAFAAKVGIPPGWFVLSWAWMPDKQIRRRSHGRWFKITHGSRSVYRVLRFSGNLKADTKKREGTIVIDYPAWLELNDYAEDLDGPVNLTIEPVSRWRFWTMAVSHPDPVYRLAGALGLTSLGLGVLSLGVSIWSLCKTYWP